jgi:hypothetical protein
MDAVLAVLLDELDEHEATSANGSGNGVCSGGTRKAAAVTAGATARPVSRSTLRPTNAASAAEESLATQVQIPRHEVACARCIKPRVHLLRDAAAQPCL